MYLHKFITIIIAHYLDVQLPVHMLLALLLEYSIDPKLECTSLPSRPQHKQDMSCAEYYVIVTEYSINYK